MTEGYSKPAVRVPDDTPFGLPNCGVVALAMILGSSHAYAWDTLKSHNARNGNWKGRTFDRNRYDVLLEHGVSFSRYTPPRGRQPTLKAWMQFRLDPEATYEVTITGHAMIVHKGLFYDQNHRIGRPLSKSPYLKRKVRHVIRITKGSPLLNL